MKINKQKQNLNFKYNQHALKQTSKYQSTSKWLSRTAQVVVDAAINWCGIYVSVSAGLK